MEKQLANILTGCRILCSMLLLFFPVFSVSFYIAYLLCGFSDMIDGTVARKTNSASDFGARFDTAADFIFAAASLVKLLPAIPLPKWLWIWIAVIAAMKVVNLVLGFVARKKLVSVHTVPNKITGLFLFLLPLTLYFIDIQYSSPVVCSIATFAAIQEGYYVGTGRHIVSSP